MVKKMVIKGKVVYSETVSSVEMSEKRDQPSNSGLTRLDVAVSSALTVGHLPDVYS